MNKCSELVLLFRLSCRFIEMPDGTGQILCLAKRNICGEPHAYTVGYGRCCA